MTEHEALKIAHRDLAARDLAIGPCTVGFVPAEQEHSFGYDVWLVTCLPKNDIGIDGAGTGYIIDAKTGEFIRRPY